MKSNIVLQEQKDTYPRIELLASVKCILAPNGTKSTEKITGPSDSQTPRSQWGTPH